MRLDLSKIPLDITFKNDGERTKMLLCKLVSKYVDNGETITVTANSSDEAAIIYTRLKDLGINIDDESDTLPDKIVNNTNVTISLKDYIDPKIFADFEKDVIELVKLELEYMAFIQEHQEKGDIDDPEIQAEIDRLNEEGIAKSTALRNKFGWYIDVGEQQKHIGVFDTSMDMFAPVGVTITNGDKIVYLYPSFANSIQSMAEIMSGGIPVDFSAVTKPGWYKMNSGDDEISCIPWDTPKNFEMTNITLSNGLGSLSQLEKSMYKNIFESVIVDDTIAQG